MTSRKSETMGISAKLMFLTLVEVKYEMSEHI